jgi:hypothetical protein
MTTVNAVIKTKQINNEDSIEFDLDTKKTFNSIRYWQAY